MRTGLRRTLWVLAPLALFAACRDGKDPTGAALPPGVGPRTTISDATGEGNPHFYWLPPMAAQPDSFAGTFDATLQPRVQVCEVEAGSCGRVVAEFGFGKGTDAVRVSAGDEHYLVNWHTRQYGLDPERTYRITVSAAAPDGAVRELGHADVDVVASQRDMVTVETARYVGLVAGTTLPIKFRIEQGAPTYQPMIHHLDPEVGAIHVTPSDPVLVTRPLGGGEVLQVFGTRDSAGIPTRLRGHMRRNLTTGEMDIVTYNEMGAPEKIRLRDGSFFEFMYLSSTRVLVTVTLPDGYTETELVEIAPGLMPSGPTPSHLTAPTQPSTRASTAEGLPHPLLEVSLYAKMGDQTEPVPGAIMAAGWEAEETINGVTRTDRNVVVMEEVEGRPGTFRGDIPFSSEITNPAPGERVCLFVNEYVSPTCSWMVGLSTALGALCAKSKVPYVCKAAAAAGVAAGALCFADLVCDSGVPLLKWRPAQGRLSVTTMAYGNGVPGVHQLKTDFYPMYQRFYHLDQYIPSFIRLRTDPPVPSRNGDSYTVYGRLYPRVAGVTVHMTVFSTDLFSGHGGTLVANTDSDGQISLAIPTPELRGNVHDIIRIWHGDPSHDPDGYAGTRQERWVYFR